MQSACHYIFHAACHIHAIRRSYAEARQSRLVVAFPHQTPSLSEQDTHIQSTHDAPETPNTPDLSFLFLSCSTLCLCNAFVVLAHLDHAFTWLGARLYFVPVLLFCSVSPARSPGSCAFSFGCFSVCFAACIRCLVEHIKYKYALILVLHFPL